MPDYFREPPKRSAWSSADRDAVGRRLSAGGRRGRAKDARATRAGQPGGRLVDQVHVLAPQHDLAKNSAKVSSGGESAAGRTRPRKAATGHD